MFERQFSVRARRRPQSLSVPLQSKVSAIGLAKNWASATNGPENGTPASATTPQARADRQEAFDPEEVIAHIQYCVATEADCHGDTCEGREVRFRILCPPRRKRCVMCFIVLSSGSATCR